MDPDAADLSSVTSSLAELARRVDEVARRRSVDPDDPYLARLHEIERTLHTAERRLRVVIRELAGP
ncbi:MAG: hypothetical protein D6683_04750 [Actinomyces sp.]|nr:MAG: hypothetical protein D6683_04750 [Actinomyces sp.]